MPKHNQTSFRLGHYPLNKKYDICTVSDCGKKHEARGYCVKHYKRLRHTGSPFTPTTRDTRPLIYKGTNVYIPLGIGAKGGYAVVIQQDWWQVDNYKWHKNGSGYAVTRKDGRLIMMHRLILSEPEGIIDHINRDKLDNRRANLRVVDNQTNALNTGIRNTNTSGYTGVSWSKTANKWEAYITRNGKRRCLGLYKTPELASKAYQEAAGKEPLKLPYL